MSVRFLDSLSAARPEIVEPTRADLASRPGSIADLLSETGEHVQPATIHPETLTELPGIRERLAKERLDRTFETQVVPETIAHVDAKIIEIAEETARQDIQVTRRLVKPSSTRVLDEGETPILGGADGDPEFNEVLTIQPFALAGNGGATTADAPLTPPEDLPAIESLPEAPSLEGLPVSPAEPVLPAIAVAKQIATESRLEVMDELVEVRLATYIPKGAAEGFFQMGIVPKEGKELEILSKDVSFVIDASSSIAQHKLDLTVAGVKQALKRLRPTDRFNVIVFRDSPTSLQPDLVAATPENIASAGKFVAGLKSKGETDVYQAIRPVVLSQKRQGIPSIVLLSTDGRATVGERDAQTIINALTSENQAGSTIFSFGGGKTVNRYLLDLLAYRNRGESRVESHVEKMDTSLVQFFSQLSDPLLVDCKVDFTPLNESDIFPRDFADFYRGRAVTVFGRYSPSKDHTFSLRLSGLAGADKKEVIFKADFKNAAKGNEDIARNWAFRKIYWLMGEICRVGEDPALLNEIQQLSSTYRISTIYSKLN